MLGLLLCFALPAFAQAQMLVKVTNKTTKKISLTLHYKDAASEDWITRGWWNIEPKSIRDITLNTTNTVAYFYATAGKSWWGGNPNDESSSISRGIISERFQVKGAEEPSGDNYRVVPFKKKTAKDGTFSIILTGKS